ncbi:exopolysaccharide transport family protein [Tianweitania sp.]|uniref:GumC family protein n=1 Tax=Tianweitania sp. TaxID=2021634 RepID=UPI0028A1E872|nr:exopolysaccharide transport family protein [Tianweitania sp.]
MIPVTLQPTLGMPAQPLTEAEHVSLRDVVDFIRKEWLIIGLCVLTFTVLGVTYAATALPTYTAEARLIIDTSQSRLVLQEADSVSLAMESARVDSEVELVKSRSIALAVIEKLGLVDEAEYNAEPGLLTRIRRSIKAAFEDMPSIEGNEVDARLRGAMGAYAARLGVRRLGQSYVLEISYSSSSAARAAQITNAIVDAYIAAKVESKAEAARRGAKWLEGRLDELGTQANQAAAAVEQFRTSQRLFTSRTDGPLADRELRDTSTQLQAARGESSRLKARLDAVDAILRSGAISETMDADIGETPVLTTLRQRLLDARIRQADLSARYGAEGAAPSAVAAEIEQIREEMRSELTRLRTTYKLELDTAERNRLSTDDTLEQMLDQAGEASVQYVRLAELESRASTFRRMYELMLQHFTQTVQRESFPVSDARIVTPAVQPFTPSQPKTTLIVSLGVVLGGVLGVGAALMRRALAPGVRSRRQIESRAGVPCIAVLPRPGRLAALRAWMRGKEVEEDAFRTVLAAPQCEFSRALAEAKTSLDIALNEKRPMVLGITSVNHDAGRAQISSNLALLYAAGGASTLFVDADRLHSGLTQEMESVEDGTAEERSVIGRSVLEIGNGIRFVSLADLTGKDAHRAPTYLKLALREAAGIYDVIIVDLPPLKEAPDARAISAGLDGILISCRYLRTPVADIAGALASLAGSPTRFRAVMIDGALEGSSVG